MAINTIQIVAIIIMIIDHIGKYFLPQYPIFQIIGRIGMPLWPFFIYYGYIMTSNVKAYKERILIIAIISQLPFVYLAGNHLNPVFSLLMGLQIISQKTKILIFMNYLIAWLLVIYFGMDAFFFNGIMVFYYIYNDTYRFIGILILVLLLCIIDHPFQIFSILGMPLISLKKEFFKKLPRLLKYGIYPGHYTIFGVIQWLFV